MLLPGLLREHRPALRIGYFHHIPFPSYELFRILPERAEILRGVLGADLVAFHTHDYMRHFIGTAERVLHIDFRLDETQIGNRCVRVTRCRWASTTPPSTASPRTPERNR